MNPSKPHITSRRLTRIQQCEINTKYVPGSDVKLADALSRVNPCNIEPILGLDLSLHEVHMHLKDKVSSTRTVGIRMETPKDSILHALYEIISLGWPEIRAHCPTHMMPFWNFRDEPSVEDGLVLKALSYQCPYTPQH